ncbi:MAG: aldehyde dehydrogenase family protein [Actinomycetota bacterium]|nr:aldehyde dehydrogenase family protein [Actinomycetota bacterium]MDH5313558.1 aldehyde dehydrogenase family protein [Actinomycetota bacterium]
MPTIRSLVNGTPIDGAPGGVLTSSNPARLDDTIGEAALGDASTLVGGCTVAREAQRLWAATPAPTRGRVVQQFGRLVEENAEPLSQLITREIGKPIRESRGEVQEVVDTCNFFLSEGRRLYGQTVPSEMRDKQLFTFRAPVGVAAIVTAGNFPVAVPSWYIVPALVCGNAVVWKPAEYTPATAEAFAQLLLHSGVPAGVFSMVLADGPSTFQGLEQALDAELIDKIGFTGSTEIGRRIGELAGRHLQTPCLELGGKNPLVVMPDADLDLAVEGALFSGFGTAGQRCTSLGTVIVHTDVHDDFLGRLSKAAAQAPIGDPTAEVLYGPMISSRFCERFETWLELVAPHHSLLGSTGVGRIRSASNPREGFVGDPDAGLYYHPTIVDGVLAGDDLYATETFGPLVGVATFETFDEALALANGHGYGLSSSIYTSDPLNVFRFRDGISAGMVSVNNSTSGAEAHLPFGGNGRSGNGSRQSGIWVLDQFTRWQSMNWDYSGHLQKAQMDIVDVDADLGFRLPS